ncbi:MAG: hypothetical protein WCI95_07670 [bacterium]
MSYFDLWAMSTLNSRRWRRYQLLGCQVVELPSESPAGESLVSSPIVVAAVPSGADPEPVSTPTEAIPIPPIAKPT